MTDFSLNINLYTMDLLWILIIGAVAGWLGSMIFQGGGLGLLGNIIVGIVGSYVGHWLLGSVLGTSLGTGLVAQILTGAIGAIVLLAAINLLRRLF